LYRPLNDPASRDPNRRLVEAMLAASALHDLGAARLTLVAPYLAYMRQDVAFRPGEAVSQKVMGRTLAQSFDTVVTVDPHLHRTGSLAAVFPRASAIAVSAAPAMAAVLRADGISGDTLLVGPDEESKVQVSAVAAALGLEWVTAEKTRRGDRSVSIRLPPSLSVRNRSVVLIDDVVSTGMTLMECARLLRAGGAMHVEALAVHALFPPEREADFRSAGLARLRCTDSMAHPCATISLAGVLADSLKPILAEAAR
jgi:ribose-phosphate pyrophosphokinase